MESLQQAMAVNGVKGSFKVKKLRICSAVTVMVIGLGKVFEDKMGSQYIWAGGKIKQGLKR